MKTLQELREFLEKGYLNYRPNLRVDCAIFGYHDGELKLLLMKNKVFTKWCLPGGFVRNDEGLDKAAARLTAERTGIDNLFLKQFKAFGDPGRNDNKTFDPDTFFELTGARIGADSWLAGKSVTIGFYAISNVVQAIPQPDVVSSECRWFAADKLPELGFDHDEMVREALATMRIHLYHFPIGKNLLPEKFTLKEIKLFYEVMSGKTLHTSNFTGKLISLGLIVKTDEKRNIGAHRSPVCYRFDEAIYEKALMEGLVLV
ncbi:MAG TPA: NUDIX domain-containing protein [Chitinophagaceae bacterium]|nr:NUDIX domain-containing protein [Chitinophagaceae bacterium]